MGDLLNILSNSGLLMIGAGLLGGLLGLAFSYREIGKIVRILRTQTGVIGAINSISSDENFETLGKAESGTTLQSPITKTPCVLWEVSVSEKRSSGKNSHWVTVFHRISPEQFYISDGTGKLTIDPSQRLELILREDVRKSSGVFSSLDEQVETALNELGVDTKGFLNLNKNLRIQERFIERGDDIYVIGRKTYGDEDLVGDVPLIVSDYSERELLGRFLWHTVGKVFLGILLGAFIVFVLYNR
jgi:ABC-type phosphate/phosphonate transport system permease subunit